MRVKGLNKILLFPFFSDIDISKYQAPKKIFELAKEATILDHEVTVALVSCLPPLSPIQARKTSDRRELFKPSNLYPFWEKICTLCNSVPISDALDCPLCVPLFCSYHISLNIFCDIELKRCMATWNWFV